MTLLGLCQPQWPALVAMVSSRPKVLLKATSVSMTPTEPGGVSMCDAPVTNKGSAVSPDTGSTQAGVVCADSRVHMDIRRATSGTGVKPQSESLLPSIPPVAIRAK